MTGPKAPAKSAHDTAKHHHTSHTLQSTIESTSSTYSHQKHSSCGNRAFNSAAATTSPSHHATFGSAARQPAQAREISSARARTAATTSERTERPSEWARAPNRIRARFQSSWLSVHEAPATPTRGGRKGAAVRGT